MTHYQLTDSIEKSAAVFRSARRVVALTGAGVSTRSGIPDFRSHDSGLWNKVDAMKVASLTSFRYQPKDFFKWVRPLVKTMIDAEPNPAHTALAKLEQAGFLHGIITQNIDDLHRKAGSKCVYEIHGHLREATCTSCYKKHNAEALINAFARTGALPYCDDCLGLLKPDIILFGEQLPTKIICEAQALIDKADLVVVAGSSMEVMPAASMPIPALNAGAKLIIINHDPTYLDLRADFVFHDDVADVLPMILQEVLREPHETQRLFNN
ncbi:MAG: NAD-dependent deacylase [Anaerolineales bacterium]|nr:NAD-dependent deacylase [Anaerolineales bacterium]